MMSLFSRNQRRNDFFFKSNHFTLIKLVHSVNSPELRLHTMAKRVMLPHFLGKVLTLWMQLSWPIKTWASWDNRWNQTGEYTWLSPVQLFSNGIFQVDLIFSIQGYLRELSHSVTFSNNIQWWSETEHHSRGIRTQGPNQMSDSSRFQESNGENGGLL